MNDDFDTDTPAAAPESHWQPEQQFIGALLHLDVPACAELVDLVPTTAIWTPIARWAFELIATLTAAGTRPEPIAILALARRQPPASENNVLTGLVITTQRPSIHADLGRYLADALTRVIDPNDARSYAREVLDDAFRRAAADWGVRLQEMAEACADREDLTTVITEGMRGQLRDLWRRAEHARRAPRPAAVTDKTA